jgi:hypothetical protein
MLHQRREQRLRRREQADARGKSVHVKQIDGVAAKDQSSNGQRQAEPVIERMAAESADLHAAQHATRDATACPVSFCQGFRLKINVRARADDVTESKNI